MNREARGSGRASLACRTIGFAAALCFGAATAAAQSGGGGQPAPESASAPKDPIARVLSESKITIDARARYEYADQDGPPGADPESSDAGTLRVRLGVLSPVIRGFQLFGELEHTEAADRNSYYAATVHGPGDKTVIADPETTELNQAWVSYTGFDSTAKLGRQRIKLDNDRFIGNVGWRQNEQTYDSITIVNQSIPHLKLYYGYLWGVQRIFGDDRPSNLAFHDFDSRSHLVNAQYNRFPAAVITGYAYLLDLEDGRTGLAQHTPSNQTYGVSLQGKLAATDDLSVGYYAEWATQEDYDDNPNRYDADYIHVNASATFQSYTLKVGVERLEGDNGVGFQTPLATLHAFNGWADVFLATPADGLTDRYIGAMAGLPLGITLQAWYHDFTPEGSGSDYGKEWNFAASKKLPYDIVALAKYADFDSERTGFRDIKRFWFQLEYQY